MIMYIAAVISYTIWCTLDKDGKYSTGFALLLCFALLR